MKRTLAFLTAFLMGMSAVSMTNGNDGAIDFYEQDGWLIADVLMAI